MLWTHFSLTLNLDRPAQRNRFVNEMQQRDSLPRKNLDENFQRYKGDEHCLALLMSFLHLQDFRRLLGVSRVRWWKNPIVKGNELSLPQEKDTDCNKTSGQARQL